MDFIPLISFLSGIASIISPCIIPVLPILFGFTLKNKQNNEIFAFVLGLFSVFTVLIFITAFFTVVFYSYITYLRLASAIILLIIGLLFILDKAFNLSFKNKNNSFLLGVLTSFAWSPCYGGYLISLISLLLTTGNVLYNCFNIILYCLGFALTLLILSIIISRLNLEKLIKNAGYVRKLSGILFVFAGLYMFLTAIGVIL